MKVCFPVQKDEGLTSVVYNHFGSAPLFLIIDTQTNDLTAVKNRDQHHVHGQCNPVQALDNRQVDAVIVGGIGPGAVSKLGQMGIKVHKAQAGTVSENLDIFKAGNMPELSLQGCCGSHGHGHHGHGHSHGGGCAH